MVPGVPTDWHAPSLPQISSNLEGSQRVSSDQPISSISADSTLGPVADDPASWIRIGLANEMPVLWLII